MNYIVEDTIKNIDYYHCRSAMICRDDLELRWRLLMLKMGFRTYLYYYTSILHFNYL